MNVLNLVKVSFQLAPNIAAEHGCGAKQVRAIGRAPQMISTSWPGKSHHLAGILHASSHCQRFLQALQEDLSGGGIETNQIRMWQLGS